MFQLQEKDVLRDLVDQRLLILLLAPFVAVIALMASRHASRRVHIAIAATASAGGLSDSRAVIISVGNVDRPPALAVIGDKSANEGQLLTFILIASDPDGDAVVVSAVNGLGANVGTSVSGSSGGTFVIAGNGSYTFDPGTAFDGLAQGQSQVVSLVSTTFARAKSCCGSIERIARYRRAASSRRFADSKAPAIATYRLLFGNQR